LSHPIGANQRAAVDIEDLNAGRVAGQESIVVEADLALGKPGPSGAIQERQKQHGLFHSFSVALPFH
jgi:hypothetical protein